MGNIVTILKQGGIGVLPTDTIYGLVGSALSQRAVKRIYKVRKRNPKKPFIILISSKAETLLPTIFSRCQTIKFYPSQKYAFSKQQQGILQNILPVINQDLAEKFLFAKNVNLENGNAIEILEVLQRHFRNLLLIKIGVVKGEESKYSIEKLKKILRLIETISHQVATTNASSKLALEIILLEL